MLALDPVHQTLSRVPARGDNPGPVARLACAAMEDSLYAFGGWDGRAWLDSLHRLDLSTRRWAIIAASGFTPWKRAHACLLAAAASSTRWLFLHGGGDAHRDFDDMYALDVQGGYWARISNASGADPVAGARNAHGRALRLAPGLRAVGWGGSSAAVEGGAAAMTK